MTIQAGSALAEREHYVLQAEANGFSHEDVAEQLDLEVHEVRAAIKRAVKRLNASNRVHAIAIALRTGLIQ